MNSFIFKAKVSKIIQIFLKELNRHRIICLNKTLLIHISMIHFLWLKTNRLIKRTLLINQCFNNRNGDQFMRILIFQIIKLYRTKLNKIYHLQSHHKLLVKLKRLFHHLMTKQAFFQMARLVKLQVSIVTRLQSWKKRIKKQTILSINNKSIKCRWFKVKIRWIRDIFKKVLLFPSL